MTAFQTISRRSIDQLETDIISLSRHINTSEYEFLVLLREFDLRQGWKEYHFNNCAEWLNMKCGIQLSTGREKVRTAHALWDLPRTSAAFRQGALSYSKARAVTRLATPHNEQSLLDYAVPATADQVQNHCRQLRNAQRDVSTVDVNRLHKQRYLSSRSHGDGGMTISVELTREAGELVMKALAIALNDQVADGRTELGEQELHAARLADALVAMAQSYMAGGTDRRTSSADHYQVVVHVDDTALQEDPLATGKSDLPIESVRRLCCDSSLVAVNEDEKGNPLNVGRKHRIVQPALKRALLARDKCCRFPGCTHDRWLDAHHVRHWVDGGETSLINTLLLCSLCRARHNEHYADSFIMPRPRI